MSGKNINFNDKKINKDKFYRNKKLFNIDDIDVKKILISKKEPYGKKSSFKYSIGYNDNDDIRPICIKLPQMIWYDKYFNINKTMFFKFINEKLLKSYTKIWERLSNLMNIEFDSEPIYGDNGIYIKKKIKLYGDEENINF